MTDKVKKEIESCRTANQARKILAKYNIPIIRDNSADYNGQFSVWIDDRTRIYQPYNRKYMVVQKWNEVKFNYSGIPTFFG